MRGGDFRAFIDIYDEEMIDAVICGYNYFILYNRCVSDEVASLIEFISEYEAR